MLHPLQIIKKISFLYLLFYLLFFIIKYDDFPAWYDSLLQLGFLILINISAKFIFVKKKNTHLYFGIFIFHIICAFLSQYINYSIYNDVYGYNPIDAQLYRSIAFDYNSESMLNMLNELSKRGYLFDDFGYPIVTWFVGSISTEYFISLLVITNAVVITVSSCYLYKLSSMFVNCSYAKLIAFLWGTMPFAIFVTANGLKENVFLMFIIIALWRLYICARKFSLYNLVAFLLFCSSLFMFRLVLGYAMLFAYISYVMFNNPFIKKHYKIIMPIIIVFILIISKSVSNSIIDQRGHDMSAMSENLSTKIAENGGGIALATNYLSAFFGPFPNYITDSYEKGTYITRYSYSALTKSVLSFFLICSLWFIAKKRITILFPMLVFWGINTIMLIFTFRTLDLRFQWPHIPIVLILSFYMYEQIGYKSKIRILYNSYILFICLFIFAYNMR